MGGTVQENILIEKLIQGFPKQRCLCFPSETKYIIHRDGCLGFWSAHLKGHLGQEGELVLLKQRLAGVEEDGVGDALHEDRDAPLRVLHPVGLLHGSVEQHTESLRSLQWLFKGDTWCLDV